MSVRVRIAPAPSGSLHIGNARTALYNWLFARHNGGQFILRIEDTDQERVEEEYVASVIDEMHWMGLDYDEGPGIGGPHAPYRQSERLDTYKGAAEKLMDAGLAYHCYCTPEELAQRRERAITEHRKPGYDGRCYRLTNAEREAFEAEGRRWVIRFHVEDGETAFEDLITGPVVVAHSEIEDFPILRQNGFPIYVFGAAVDDALMKITHVIRGLDLQSASPRQILLLRALGYEPPLYAHIPLVFGSGGKKLSKRYGGGSVEWYRDRGFLPDALMNSLVLLGTGFGDQTIISREEMVKLFALEKVNASPASLNSERLEWTNGEYIRMMDDAQLAEVIVPWLSREGLIQDPPTKEEAEKLQAAAPLIKTRMKRLEETPSLIRSWFVEVSPDENDFARVMREPYVTDLLDRSYSGLESLSEWNLNSIEEALRRVVNELGLKPRVAFKPFYVAISGAAASAPLFDTMVVIGRAKSLERLKKTRALLENS